MHSAILVVLNQIFLKNVLLSISESLAFAYCTCTFDCDNRAGHTRKYSILLPVETLLSISNLETLLLIMLSTSNNSNLMI